MKYNNNTIRQKLALSVLVVIFSLLGYGQVNNTYNLMPAPLVIQPATGRIAIDHRFRVAISGKADLRIYAEASRFVRRLLQYNAMGC
jgi:hypothetical protein